MPKEIELKLLCDPADLDEIAAHPRLASAPSEAAQHETVYFDTEAGDLRRAGLALRVRRRDGRYVQTLKRGRGVVRSEWEAAAPGSEPDPAAFADKTANDLLKEVGPLVAAFSVTVERRSFVVAKGTSRIEVVLDSGRIDAGAAFAPVCEIELELKDGAIADVFALADDLAERASLTLGVESKSERGYALAAGSPRGPAHADAVALDAAMSTVDAFQAIAQSAIRQLRLNEAVLLDRRDTEALHQARVAVRRLRSAFSLFGDLAEDGRSRVLRDELKRLSAPLGEARNLDVFLSETLPAERVRRPDEPGLLELEKSLEVERTEAYARVGRLIRSAEWRGLAIDLTGWLHAGPWLRPKRRKDADRLERPVRTFAGKALEKRLRQIRRRGRGLVGLTDAERHQVRIAAKKLRYGVEFYESLYDGARERKRLRALRREIKALQSSLGALNDIATAREVAERGGARRGGSALFAAGLAAGDMSARVGPLIAEAKTARKAALRLRPFWR